MQTIFAPYKAALHSVTESDPSEEKKDSTPDQSKYVFNQLLSSQSGAKEIFQDLRSTYKDYLLPRIHIGDINSDGYPDILVTIQYNNGSSIPYVLLNEEMPKVLREDGSDSDVVKLEKETIDQRQAKNRYFNLNATSNEYHGVLSKY